LDLQTAARPASAAFDSTGKSIEARIAMMAMTTKSSIKVNPDSVPDMFRFIIVTSGLVDSWKAADTGRC